jgi:predicted RNase H-like HicB family nuclease
MKWRVVRERDPETGDWAVWCPELPGCTSAGETQEEALDNIREAIRLWRLREAVELYLDPEPLKLSEGAIIKEVSIG